MTTCGLDFGTTNSSIGFNTGKKSKIVKLGKKSFEDRTALFYSFEDREYIVGIEGINRKKDGESGRLILSPKSFLNSEEDIKTYIGSKEYSLEKIISIIIKDYKTKLENVINQEVDSVLLGRPVKFHNSQEKLDKLAQNRLEKAISLAGFKNIEFQYEPVAAAKAYLDKNPLFREGNIIIADLGGGTSDFSIINVSSGKEKVIGNNGIYIGGDELDKQLSLKNFSLDLGKNDFYTNMGKRTLIPNSYYNTLSDWKSITELLESKISIKELLNKVEDKNKFNRLIRIVDDISIGYEYYELVKEFKEKLTESNNYKKLVNIFGEDLKYEKELTRSEFEEIISNERGKILGVISELLKQTNLKAEEIDKVVITGGTGLIPSIRQGIEEILGQCKIVDFDTFTSVTYGLTKESYEKFM